MRCGACGWTNPARFTHCHNCGKPLAPEPQALAARASHASGDVFAGEGTRIVAALVDLCLLALLLPGLLIGGMSLARVAEPDGSVLLGLLSALALFAVLLPALMDSYGKGSLGKRLLGLRVVDADGAAPGFARSILRTIAKYALHPLLSLPVLMAERMLFGRHSLHNLLTGCYVVSAKASPDAIRYRLRHDVGSARMRKLARVVGALLVAAIATVGALLGHAALTAEPNPRRDAARAAFAAANDAARRIGTAWRSTGHFSAQWNDAVPPVLGSIEIEAASGTLTATASHPLIAGAHFVLTPNLASTKGGKRIGWRCTSPDLPAADLPFGCRSATSEAAPARP